MTKNELQQMFYTYSPHELGTDADNTYRDAVDRAIDQMLGACAHCGEPMHGLIRIHHHTEDGKDVTQHG